MDSPFRIRPFVPGDREAVRALCAATAWMGRPAPERIGDAWIWAEFWTRYFTDREPQHTWVVERTSDSTLVGYLTGTADARRADRFVLRLVPGIVWRVIRRRLLRDGVARPALLGLLRSALRRELEVSRAIQRRFPATLHIDLLPEARGQGLASQLLARYLEAMRRLGIPGVHAQSLADNAAIIRFNERAGFREVARTRLTAFTHLDGEPIEVITWTMELQPQERRLSQST